MLTTIILSMLTGGFLMIAALIAIAKRGRTIAAARQDLVLRNEYVRGRLKTWDDFYDYKKAGNGFAFALGCIGSDIADQRQDIADKIQQQHNASRTIVADIDLIEKSLKD